MIKHIVVWKLKESHDAETRSRNASIIKEQLESLKEQIEEVVKIEVGIGAGLPGSTWDLVLYSEFKSQADLDAYQKHPKHKAVVETVKAAVEARQAVDYIV